MDLAARMVIELLREGQRARFTARGGSMWPAVRDGSLVEVTPCPAIELAPGELGAYVGTRGLVVHRVVAREPGGLRFRGDARAADDGVVDDARVLGRACVVTAPPWRVPSPHPRHLMLAWRAARSWLRRALART
jgi:hypothetical protein